MLYSNGDIYEGAWEAGNYHGSGELTSENLGTMQGKWWQGVLADGSVTKFHQTSTCGEYSGQIKNCKPGGEGTMLYADGRVDKGIWELGLLVYGKVDFTASALVNQNDSESIKPYYYEGHFENAKRQG